MTLTPAQLTTLKTHILANTDQDVIDALANGDNGSVAAWYNETASPDFFVLDDQIDVDNVIEVLDWATDYATFKDDISAFLLLFRNRTYKVRSEGARNALNAILSGANSSKVALLAAVSRLATNAEKLFATDATGPGGGDGGTTGTSANTNFVGALTHKQVGAALNS